MERSCPVTRSQQSWEVKSITEREGRTGIMDFILFEIRFTNQNNELVVKEELRVVELK